MPSSTTSASGSFRFLFAFGLYSAVAAFLLTLGLVSAAAAWFGPVRAAVEASTGSSNFGILSQALLQSSSLTLAPYQVAIDYTISVLNFGLAIFLIRKRPADKVVRLLGFAMVGTAAAFNLQAHSVYDAFASFGYLAVITFLHFLFHTVSAVTYLHALIAFPNGTIRSRRASLFIKVMYFLAAEEMVLLVLFLGTDKTWPLPPIIIESFAVLFHVKGGVGGGSIGSIIQADTTLFILLFGLVMPLVAFASQYRHYRTATSQLERDQRKLLAWALMAISTLGVILFTVIFASSVLSPSGFTTESVESIENLGATVFFPVFSLIPVTLTFAILRYRLFQIEVVLGRGLVYLPLTAISAGIFAALSTLFQRFLLALTGATSDFAAVIAALIAAAAFAPIRLRLQKFVDKHFKEVQTANSERNDADN